MALVPALMVLESFQRAPIRSRYLSQFLGDQGYADSAYARRAEANLSYPGYLLIGAIYNAALLAAAYSMFLKKAQY